MKRIDEGYDDYGRLMGWRYTTEDFVGPTVLVEREKETEDETLGYTLKLDLTQHEHDQLIVALKKESYNPAIKKILYEIIGYDEAVERAKEYARQQENSAVPNRETAQPPVLHSPTRNSDNGETQPRS